MYCTNCGKEVHPQAVACPACGVPPRLEKKFCSNCAEPLQKDQAICLKCGSAIRGNSAAKKDKLVAGLLGILLGALGIHKFYLGYNKEGIIMLVISLVSCGFAAPVMGIVGLIEGILYLTRSDDEFVSTYVDSKKGWF